MNLLIDMLNYKCFVKYNSIVASKNGCKLCIIITLLYIIIDIKIYMYIF